MQTYCYAAFFFGIQRNIRGDGVSQGEGAIKSGGLCFLITFRIIYSLGFFCYCLMTTMLGYEVIKREGESVECIHIHIHCVCYFLLLIYLSITSRVYFQ